MQNTGPSISGGSSHMRGCTMITRDDLIRIASRYDTLMAHAMLRALGADAPMRTRGRTTAKHDRYAGAAELMRQTHGVNL